MPDAVKPFFIVTALGPRRIMGLVSTPEPSHVEAGSGARDTWWYWSLPPGWVEVWCRGTHGSAHLRGGSEHAGGAIIFFPTQLF
jgi:hypothetical protein